MSDRLAFDDGLLSDLTLTCHEQTVKVHKVILYRTSGWFRHEFQSKPKTDLIELEDEDTDALWTMLKQCYKNLNEDETELLETCGHDFLCLVQIYNIANKYEVDSVTDDCLKAIARLLDETSSDSLAAAQWYEALDCAFEGDPGESLGLARLHDFLSKKMSLLMPTMLSDHGGYASLIAALSRNGRLAAAVFRLRREQDAAVERATKRRKCCTCQLLISLTGEDGKLPKAEHPPGCWVCGTKLVDA